MNEHVVCLIELGLQSHWWNMYRRLFASLFLGLLFAVGCGKSGETTDVATKNSSAKTNGENWSFDDSNSVQHSRPSKSKNSSTSGESVAASPPKQDSVPSRKDAVSKSKVKEEKKQNTTVVADVYWIGPKNATSNVIRKYSLDSKTVEDLLELPKQALNLDVDASGKKIYWSRQHPGQVFRANLDGTDVEQVIGGGLHGVQYGIAVSPDEQLFLCGHTFFLKSQLDGTGMQKLASPQYPAGIAIDTRNRKVYWGADGAIHFANLDGSDIQKLSGDFSNPNRPAIHSERREIYWIDWKAQVTYRTSLTTGNREVVVRHPTGRDNLPIAQCIDPSGKYLYWATKAAVMRSSLDGTQQETIARPGAVGDCLAFSHPSEFKPHPVVAKSSTTMGGDQNPRETRHEIRTKIDTDISAADQQLIKNNSLFSAALSARAKSHVQDDKYYYSWARAAGFANKEMDESQIVPTASLEGEQLEQIKIGLIYSMTEQVVLWRKYDPQLHEFMKPDETTPDDKLKFERDFKIKMIETAMKALRHAGDRPLFSGLPHETDSAVALTSLVNLHKSLVNEKTDVAVEPNKPSKLKPDATASIDEILTASRADVNTSSPPAVDATPTRDFTLTDGMKIRGAVIGSKYDTATKQSTFTIKKPDGSKVVVEQSQLASDSVKQMSSDLRSRRIKERIRQKEEKAETQRLAEKAEREKREREFDAVYPKEIMEHNRRQAVALTRWITLTSTGSEQRMVAAAFGHLKLVVDAYALDGGLENDVDRKHVAATVARIPASYRKHIEEVLTLGGAGKMRVKVRGKQEKTWDLVWSDALKLSMGL